MAGVSGFKPNSKSKFSQKIPSSPERNEEKLNPPTKPNKAPVFSLRGILGLGQTVDLHQSVETSNSWEKHWNFQPNHLEHEAKILFDQRQKELQKEIEELRQEIKKLAVSTENLKHDIEIAIEQPITDTSIYELGFLQRLKNLIFNFRKNISEASNWIEMFQTKKKKKHNTFWNNVKKSGEAYLFSGEHSVARSAT